MKKKFRFGLLVLSLIVAVALLKFKFSLTQENQEFSEQQAISKNLALIRKNDESTKQLDANEVQAYMDLAKKIFSDKTDKETFQRDGVSFKVRVVDQFGEPVVGAQYGITYQKGFDSKRYLHGEYGLKTDENGMFDVAIEQKISGLRVAAVKVGYIQEPGKSDKNISMANARKLTKNLNQEEKEKWEKLKISMNLPYNTLETLLDEQGVVTLTLKKMSDYDKMYQNMYSFSVDPQGATGKIPGKYMMEYRNQNSDGLVPVDAHVIQIGPIFYDSAKEKQITIRYKENRGGGITPAAPWFSEMSIPSGGFYLIDEKEEPDGYVYQSPYAADANEGEEFLAPESGYVETVRAEMPESRMNETWRGGFTKNYYVKFSDNTYGRIKVTMGRGGYNIVSWYNPTGRRNTEFCLEDDLDIKYIEKKR